MIKHVSLFISLFFFFSLTACVDTVKTTDEESTTATTVEEEQVDISKFSEEKEKSNEYSYRMVMKTIHKADNTTSTFTYKFAKSGATMAYSMSDDEYGESIFLVSATHYYMITISDAEKSAMIMLKDGDDTYDEPDFTYLTDFNDYYDFQKKTDNVMVGNVKTTCYEYSYFGVTYKYYVNASEYVIKVDFESNEDYFSVEILDFKTTNIDKSILTIPTEAAGYTIFDFTDL